VRALGLTIFITACAGAPARPPALPPGPEAIGGYWALADGSNVVMQVTLLGAKPSIDAWATDTGVHFDVEELAWDGRRLRARFTYAPTGTITISDVVLVNPDRLEGEVSGAYSARETWIRVAPDEVTPSAPGGARRTPP
jgi:hypothetical protein